MKLPDPGTLDALVLGADYQQEPEAWEQLVKHPKSAVAWDAAVKRRQQLDAMSLAVQNRPWLAQLSLSMSRSARKLKTIPSLVLRATLKNSSGSLLDATLGPSEELGEQEVSLEWGKTIPISVPLGAKVSLRSPEEDNALGFRYVYQDNDGGLPSATWKLEPGEAPVLLLALLGVPDSIPLAEALQQATGIAGVILLEALPHEKDIEESSE